MSQPSSNLLQLEVATLDNTNTSTATVVILACIHAVMTIVIGAVLENFNHVTTITVVLAQSVRRVGMASETIEFVAGVTGAMRAGTNPIMVKRSGAIVNHANQGNEATVTQHLANFVHKDSPLPARARTARDAQQVSINPAITKRQSHAMIV